MKTITVWILLALAPQLQHSCLGNLQFPTQVDCQRFSREVDHNYRQNHQGESIPPKATKCVKATVVVTP